MIEGFKVEKKRAEMRFEALLADGSREKRGQYTKEFETTVDRLDTEISKLQAEFDTLERSRAAVTDTFDDQFKDRLEAARRIQDLISKKADPVHVKGACQAIRCSGSGTLSGNWNLQVSICDWRWRNKKPCSFWRTVSCYALSGARETQVEEPVLSTRSILFEIEVAEVAESKALSPQNLKTLVKNHGSFLEIARSIGASEAFVRQNYLRLKVRKKRRGLLG